MSRSPYFNHVNNQLMKDMMMNMTQEVINLHGIDIYWIQNPHTNIDGLFSEDRLPELGEAKKLVVLFKDSVNPMQGEAMFSKFGFMNTQQTTLQIAVKEWHEVFGTHRPMEGDIFYLPKFDEFGLTDFFKVTYIDREDAVGWFSFGKHTVFEVSAEKWAYSSEDFSKSGVEEINVQLPEFSNDVEINPNLDAEPWKVNDEVQELADEIQVFDEKNPFGKS